ncbi:hypothetical protein [Prevotella sp.]
MKRANEWKERERLLMTKRASRHHKETPSTRRRNALFLSKEYLLYIQTTLSTSLTEWREVGR